MRIAVEAQRLFRCNRHGMEISALELLRALQQIDTHHKFILISRKGPYQDLTSREKFTIHYIDAPGYLVWEQVYLPKYLRKIKPDLLHCTGNTAPLKKASPFILTLHDVIFLNKDLQQGSLYQHAGNKYRSYIVPRVARKADIIVTVSAYEKQLISEKLTIHPDKIKVMYNGVNEQFYKKYDESTLQLFRYKWKLPDSYILLLGNTAVKKNTIKTLDAYLTYCNMSHNPLPLVLTDYSRTHVTSLLRQQNALHLSNNIITPGYIPYEEMPLLYQSAHIFMYTSLHESFGMPMLEAMACSIPVIASDTAAMPEIAGDAACYTDPQNSHDIAVKLYELANNEAARTLLINKGLLRAQAFSWKSAAVNMLDIYENISQY